MTISRILITLFSTLILSLLIFINPVKVQAQSNFDTLYLNNRTLIAELKYEAKEKTSLKNPVVDPNFNIMRNQDMNKFQAIFLVGAIIILAIAAPIAAWVYFSK